MNTFRISALADVGHPQFALHGLNLCMERAKFPHSVLACSPVIQSVVLRKFLSEFQGMVASSARKTWHPDFCIPEARNPKSCRLVLVWVLRGTFRSAVSELKTTRVRIDFRVRWDRIREKNLRIRGDISSEFEADFSQNDCATQDLFIFGTLIHVAGLVPDTKRLSNSLCFLIDFRTFPSPENSSDSEKSPIGRVDLSSFCLTNAMAFTLFRDAHVKNSASNSSEFALPRAHSSYGLARKRNCVRQRIPVQFRVQGYPSDKHGAAFSCRRPYAQGRVAIHG